MLYLFDTHALLEWQYQDRVSADYIAFFDQQNQLGQIAVSAATFWEVALLRQKGRTQIVNVRQWKNELLQKTNLRLLTPSADEMILSAELPLIHKDPFDRLLIAQAIHHNLQLVTRDGFIQQYNVQTFWL